MIGQYLSNTNENATVLILQKKFETKQGLGWSWITMTATVVKFVPHGTLFQASHNSSRTRCSARGIVLGRALPSLTARTVHYTSAVSVRSTPHPRLVYLQKKLQNKYCSTFIYI